MGPHIKKVMVGECSHREERNHGQEVEDRVIVALEVSEQFRQPLHQCNGHDLLHGLSCLRVFMFPQSTKHAGVKSRRIKTVHKFEKEAVF